MSDINITSNNQQGGVTAQNVNSSIVTDLTKPSNKKSYKSTYTILSVIGSIASILAFWGNNILTFIKSII